MRRYEIVRFFAPGIRDSRGRPRENQVIKIITGDESDAQMEVAKYDSVKEHSFVGYRAKDRSDEEIIASTERTLGQMKLLQSVGVDFSRGRRSLRRDQLFTMPDCD
tara:strand:+ start:796 stop:1113 length:318 start_codon:yes stop_codon:yes gene_type:complete